MRIRNAFNAETQREQRSSNHIASLGRRIGTVLPAKTIRLTLTIETRAARAEIRQVKDQGRHSMSARVGAPPCSRSRAPAVAAERVEVLETSNNDLDDLAPLMMPAPAKGTTVEKDRVPGTMS